MVVAYYKVLFMYMPEGTEENCKLAGNPAKICTRLPPRYKSTKLPLHQTAWPYNYAQNLKALLCY